MDPAYRQLREAAEIAEVAQQEHVDQLHRLADEAVARAKAATKKRTTTTAAQTTGSATDEVPRQYPTRAFWATWGELADWWTRYDPDQLAAELTDEQYRSFQATVEGTLAFAEELHAAREAHTGDAGTGGTVPVRGHLRALRPPPSSAAYPSVALSRSGDVGISTFNGLDPPARTFEIDGSDLVLAEVNEA